MSARMEKVSGDAAGDTGSFGLSEEEIAGAREFLDLMATRAEYTPLPPGSNMSLDEADEWVRRCADDPTLHEFARLSLELGRRIFAERWSSFVTIADRAPSHDFLCALAIWVGEAVLADVPVDAVDDVVTDIKEHASLRKGLSCAEVEHEDADIERVLVDLYPSRGDPDDIGRQPSS